MSPSEIWKKFKTSMLTGALVMVPLFITIYIIVAIVRLVAGKAGMGQGPVSGILGIVIAFLIVFVVGWVTQYAVGGKAMNWITSILLKVPIAGPIYSACKQIMEAFMLKKSVAFQKAVIIEYPRKGIFSIAFVTKEPHMSMILPNDDKMIHVFLPTTPNPTSGFFLIVPEKDVISLDIPVEEAFKMVISGGIVSTDPQIIQNQEE